MIDASALEGLSAALVPDVRAMEGISAAVHRAQAVIEFDLKGKVLQANKNFLDLMGYSAAEVVGRHHRIFCDPDYAESRAYEAFWETLGAGDFLSGEYRRITKGGASVWLQATYNPIFDLEGNPSRVVKFAVDITEAKLQAAQVSGRVAAIDRSQAVIEFDTTGVVLEVNRNFCDVMGYSASEVVGKHHRMFCDSGFTQTEEYLSFWESLGAGEYRSGEYKRFGKGGREVWLQATYNPILDADGRPMRVIKYASDVTEAKLRNAEVSGRMSAVDRAQAVIEFDLEGTVLSANENFLRCMGFSLREVVGQHHSVFCDDDYKRSAEYRDFWLRLRNGELISGRFHRVGKYERDVYIQATYNPIFDVNGNPVKVIKFAYDVTAEVLREQRISASTTDMTKSVHSLADSIDDIGRGSTLATELSAETQSNAERGVGALRASLEAIEMIEKSSRSIADIVRVIAEIASQTNLLAFNASIEAARAGEHGVGFSVVAGEVRKLAERSANAAQQIGDLVTESAERVSEGSAVSRKAEDAFEQIVASAARTNEAIRQISAATQTQQEASREVDTLLAQLANADGA